MLLLFLLALQSLREALQGCTSVIFAASGAGYWSANEVDNQVSGGVR
jgi:hypothetical protein